MKFTQAMGVAALATIPVAIAFAAAALPGDKDVESLLAGVAQIAAPGVPGPLCVFGDKAVVVVVGGAGKKTRAPVVAAGRMGAGRAAAQGRICTASTTT